MSCADSAPADAFETSERVKNAPLWVVEIVVIFVLFALQGGWPVPDVNEPCYLGKAIHYWNPEYGAGDFFFESDDTHWVFYLTFGWLSLLMSPLAFAWVGRLLTWWLLAWSWRRFSVAVLPGAWWSIASAALLGMLTEHCHLAGEWIIGGVEAKGFAFVLTFLGLEAVVRSRWNRGLVFLGAASLFHVLVGGWAAVAVGIVWLLSPKNRPGLWTLWPGLLGGFLLAFPSLYSALWLTWGVDPEIVKQANFIYVFERLSHHLCSFPRWYVFRFTAAAVVWGLLVAVTPSDPGRRLVALFVFASLILAGVGFVLCLLIPHDPALAAGLLRYYWFRLADVAVPIGLAVEIPAFLLWARVRYPRLARVCFWTVVLLCAAHFGYFAALRAVPQYPRAVRVPCYGSWRKACEWILESGEIPPDARFLTPRLSQTFKWYTGRAEVVSWKDLPQDADSIVAWRERLEDIYGTGLDDPWDAWHPGLMDLGSERLKALGEKYDTDYVITRKWEPLDLELLYANRYYAIYRLK